jgi:hypothetical protein
MQETRLSAQASEAGARYYELEPIKFEFMEPAPTKERALSVIKQQKSCTNASPDAS